MISPVHPVVWFITGCSTGFGRELTKAALARGHRVAATARDPLKIADLVAGRTGQALSIKLDVNDRAQAESAVKQAEAAFGRIDVLVNNAGFGYLAAIEESDERDVRAMFDTNFFGLARMIHLVLPGMRKRRAGHIINFSSIAGLVGMPALGYYCATKFAVEGLSESLAREVAALGIKVTLVEPGPFRTDWAGRSIHHARREIGEYLDTAGVAHRRITGISGRQPGDPARAAEVILRVAESPTPPLHMVLGRPALDIARAKLDQLSRELTGWEKATLSADFPDSVGASGGPAAATVKPGHRG